MGQGRWAFRALLVQGREAGLPACQVFFELLSEAGSILALVQLAKIEAAYGLI